MSITAFIKYRGIRQVSTSAMTGVAPPSSFNDSAEEALPGTRVYDSAGDAGKFDFNNNQVNPGRRPSRGPNERYADQVLPAGGHFWSVKQVMAKLTVAGNVTLSITDGTEVIEVYDHVASSGGTATDVLFTSPLFLPAGYWLKVVTTEPGAVTVLAEPGLLAGLA